MFTFYDFPFVSLETVKLRFEKHNALKTAGRISAACCKKSAHNRSAVSIENIIRDNIYQRELGI